MEPLKDTTNVTRLPGAEDARLRYVQAIETAADRATRLTAQLLAFSRRQSLSPQVFDLCESIRALSDIITTVLGARISVSVNLPDAPLPVLLDRTQLDTALINIAVNARDAIDGHGKVTIDVEQLTSVPSVRFAAPMKGNFAAISVSDTGAGIDPSVVDRIFEPFFTTKGVGAGTGLGLSQVFGFVKQSEGEVDVQSQAGVGTRFTLYLPLAQANASIELPTAQPGLLHGHGLCVLVVEDNVDVAEFAVCALRELEYNVVLARNADEALAELERDAARFHVVFSDVVMPGTNGLDLARTIRSRLPHQSHHVRVVRIGAVADDVACPFDRYVEHRQAVDIDAEAIEIEGVQARHQPGGAQPLLRVPVIERAEIRA